jgi:hypothetical protein
MDYDDNGNWLLRQPPHTDHYKGLTDEERMLSGCLQSVVCMLAMVIGLILCVIIFGSCTTTKYVPVIEHHTDTLIQTKVQHDSIYINDSTVITEKGDTVKIEKWHTKYVEKQVHDTLYIAKNDTVPQPYPVIKEVPAELTWWQQLRMHLGGILLFVALIYAFIKWGIPFIKKLIA